ncbi:hypothetical protein ACLG6S_04940 [Thermodesulfobacteriota bacterium B35]
MPENETDAPGPDTGLAEVKLFLPEDLSRAFQRCVWILVNETGRDRLDIMHEVVHDFLVKHGC